ncbi:hypothetical protein WS70_22670 [Burkholderia mayonis]|uniref:Uncharacterized protein n=2 Tax=Burkholderia mayonis TaxID=1385591 RepID=A0A1B4FLR1_9BURK|nr:hypothetical protein WS70_22670 [Burkholderia mayonis]
MYLDAIATATNGKWTRNDVINALLDKGLFALFHELKDEDVERITEQAAQQLFPPAHGVSKMEPYNGHRIEALASQTPDGRWHSIYRYALADNPAMIFTSESTEQNFATEEEAIEHGRRRAMERIDKL